MESRLFNLKFLFVLAFFLGAASLQAASLYDELSPEQKRVWKRLLHIRDGDARSLIDEAGFFVDPEGANSPAKELETFFAQLSHPNKNLYGRYKLPLVCAYPARIEFLVAAGILKQGPDDRGCSAWNKWQKEISPEALSIIFSTAYPNNPGSMFGHTFLRFHKKGQVYDLLDYGANFSAMVDPTDWGPIYAIKGLFGGYPGFFDLTPYYEKVNEYNHSENRDLIEYELDLSPKQVKFILAHLWELYNGAFFDYYFTLENCSFQLAELISVAVEIEIPHRWYYLPADLIWTINDKPHFVRQILQRRSLKEKTLARIELLDQKQWEHVKIAKEGGDFNQLGASVRTWDALIEWLNFEKYEARGKVSKQDKDLLFLALKRRASLKKKSERLAGVKLKNRPELGHYAQRVALGTGLINDQKIVRVEYRSGFHDLLANDAGFESFSQFKFLTGSLLYLRDRKKIIPENFSLLEIVSLDPWSKISQSLSWKLGGREELMRQNKSCRFCHRTRAFGKFGISFGERRLIFALFGGGVIDYSSHYKNNFIIRGNIESFAGFATSFAKFMVGVNAYFSSNAYQEYFARSNFFISRNQELRVKLSQFARSSYSITTEWGFYF